MFFTKTKLLFLKKKIEKLFLAKKNRRTEFPDPRFDGFVDLKNRVNFFQDFPDLKKKKHPRQNPKEGDFSHYFSLSFAPENFIKNVDFLFL